MNEMGLFLVNNYKWSHVDAKTSEVQMTLIFYVPVMT